MGFLVHLRTSFIRLLWSLLVGVAAEVNCLRRLPAWPAQQRPEGLQKRRAVQCTPLLKLSYEIPGNDQE